MSGPCLSSSVAGRPLRPATRHSLGEPLPHQQADRPRVHQEAPCGFGFGRMSFLAICGINSSFDELSPTSRQITHVLRTRSPLNQTCITTNLIPFDLHVLSTPPAFVLSQNQTLRWKVCVSTAKVETNSGTYTYTTAAMYVGPLKLRLKIDSKRTIQFLLYCLLFCIWSIRFLLLYETGPALSKIVASGCSNCQRFTRWLHFGVTLRLLSFF